MTDLQTTVPKVDALSSDAITMRPVIDCYPVQRDLPGEWKKRAFARWRRKKLSLRSASLAKSGTGAGCRKTSDDAIPTTETAT